MAGTGSVTAAVTREPEAGRSDGGAGRRDNGWDGGWRRVAPPAVTVARSSIGVSDGLRFRDGLASWQNLAFAGELGHAVLPSAPVGLIHGVARPGGARSTAPGGPLLLRAARTGTEGEAEPAVGGGRPAPETVQRSGGTTTTRSSGSGAPGRQSRGDGATRRNTTAGASGTPSAPAPGTDAAPGTDVAPGPVVASASQQPAGTASSAPVSLQRARPVAVRPRRTAPPLTIARRPAMALRQIAGILPTEASEVSAPVTPDATAAGTTSAPALPTGHTADRPAAAPVRPALGKPLRELPIGAVAADSTAPGGVVPSAPAGQEPAGMPVLQRQASDPAAPAANTPSPEAAKPSVRQPPASDGRVPNTRAPQSSRSSQSSQSPQPSQPDASGSSARVRGGIGAPLTSLPSTAMLRSDAPLLGDRRRAQPGSAAPRPDTASAGEPGAAPLQLSSSAPAGPTSKALGTPAEMPVRSSGVPARPDVSSVPEPAAVQRTAGATRPNASLSTPPSSASPSAPAPAGPVHVRRITLERQKGQAAGTAAVPGGPASVVQRSRALLASRALDVSTGSAEGFSAPTTAGSTARPVVAATWRRDAQQSGHTASPSSALGNAHAGEHRTQPAPAPRQSAPGGPTSGGSAPGGTAPGSTVQRLVSASPSTGTTRSSGTPSGHPPAAAPGRGARTGAGTESRAGTEPDRSPDRIPGRGPSAARSLLRLVQRSPRGGATTPSSRSDVRPAEPGPTQSYSAPPPPPAPRDPVPDIPSAPSATRPVPVVRPHPPGTGRPGATAVPVQRMTFPVVPESATPATTGPMPESAMSAPTGPPALAVRIPQRAPNPTPLPSPPPPPAAGARASAATAEVLQRAAADAGITGVPVRAAPVRRAEPPGRPASTGPDASATGDPPAAHRVTGADIEELARRLIDPVSRLIRADLRRGRERTGRPYDGRR
ncbi:hypothetical protein ACWGRV_09390 [Streptomyces sp. NPDC055663]